MPVYFSLFLYVTHTLFVSLSVSVSQSVCLSLFFLKTPFDVAANILHNAIVIHEF